MGQAQKAQTSTKVAKFIDEASLAYHELYIEKAQNGNYEISEREVLDRLEEKYGYTGKIIHGTTGTLTGITVDLETTADSRATVGIGKTKTVKVTPEGLTENNYVEIKGLYYPISYNGGKITLGEGIAEEPNTGGSGTYTLSATSSVTAKATVDCNQTAKTVTISGVADGNSDITISYGEETATVYVKVEEILKYGAEVNLGPVEVTNTTGSTNYTANLLQKWKYFYEDDAANGNIYLIYANYLENAQIPLSTENGIAKDGYNVYVDTTNYSGKTRDNLIAYLSNESTNTSGIWKGFAEGVENALNSKLAAGQKLTAGTVKAYGAPTVEQFKGSYLGNYPTSGFDANYTTSGYNNTEGYVYKVGTGNYGYSASLGNSNKALYFPETTSQIKDQNANPAQKGYAYGYWLERPFGKWFWLCVSSRL